MNKKSKFLQSVVLLLSLFCGFTVTAKDHYEINLNVKGLRNDSVFLAYYFNGKTYKCDSTKLNEKGIGKFSANKKLDEGIYIVYFNGSKYFDLMVGNEQNMTLKIDTSDFLKNQILGSAISADFNDYQHFMTAMNKERIELVDRYKSKKIDSTKYVNTFSGMTEKVEASQKAILSNHSGDFLGAYLKGCMPVETPEYKELPDSIRNRARYQHYKHHYFDNINLSDPRFLRTPYFPNMVDQYMSKTLLQDPDTLAEAAFELIEKSRGDSLTFQVMTTKMINYGISSKMMGMDGLWYKIAERYYFTGEAKWADSTWVENLRKEAKKIRFCRIGMQARELTVRDSMDRPVKLSEVPDEIVLVYFFEPSCGHCKKTTPILHDSVYTKWKGKGFEVFACYTQTDRKEWMDFVHKHHLENWINVWDPYRESWFWDSYDVSATPGMYLLNKDRKIIAKKIDTETLDMILEEELVKRKAAKQQDSSTSAATEKQTSKKGRK